MDEDTLQSSLDALIASEHLDTLRHFAAPDRSLLLQNTEARDNPFEIRNQGKVPEFYMSGVIGYNVRVKDVSKFLSDKSGEVSIGLNSPGGDAWEGIAIYNYLKNYSGKVTTRIDGRAASAAGVIFLAGDERVMMEKTSRLMLHEASIASFVYGGLKEIKSQFERIVKAMEHVNGSIISVIANSTGKTEDESKKFVTGKDEYFASDKALENNLATRVIKAKNSQDANKALANSILDRIESYG